jgi:carbohydrate-binding DOMON domain-containing protein
MGAGGGKSIVLLSNTQRTHTYTHVHTYAHTHTHTYTHTRTHTHTFTQCSDNYLDVPVNATVKHESVTVEGDADLLVDVHENLVLALLALVLHIRVRMYACEYI